MTMPDAVAAFRTAANDLAAAWGDTGASEQGDATAKSMFRRVEAAVGLAQVAADALDAAVAAPVAE